MFKPMLNQQLFSHVPSYFSICVLSIGVRKMSKLVTLKQVDIFLEQKILRIKNR